MADIFLESEYGIVEARRLRPSVAGVVAFACVSIGWYLLFLGTGLYALTGWFGVEIAAPVLVLAANATVRFVAKWIEMRADQLAVTEAVGRHRRPILLAVFASSAVAGAVAGFLIGQTPGWRSIGFPPLALVIVLTAWESLWALKFRSFSADADAIEAHVHPRRSVRDIR